MFYRDVRILARKSMTTQKKSRLMSLQLRHVMPSQSDDLLTEEYSEQTKPWYFTDGTYRVRKLKFG